MTKWTWRIWGTMMTLVAGGQLLAMDGWAQILQGVAFGGLALVTVVAWVRPSILTGRGDG